MGDCLREGGREGGMAELLGDCLREGSVEGGSGEGRGGGMAELSWRKFVCGGWQDYYRYSSELNEIKRKFRFQLWRLEVYSD